MNRISPPPTVEGRSHKAPVALGLVVFGVAVVTASAGYWYGRTEAGRDPLSQRPAQQETQLLALQSPAQQGDAGLDALAGKNGALHSELLRLNALGARLAAMAGLDPQEFAFDQPPAVGGPEGKGGRDAASAAVLTEETELLLALFSERRRKLEELERIIDRKDLEDLKDYATPSSWPVESGYISSNFGYRRHPILKRTRFHSGVDFACKRGTPVLATADGVVTFSGWQTGYGRLVEIRHPNGLVTRYAHNQRNMVDKGDRVRKGQNIAEVGSSGRSTGPHVHFEIRRNGKAVNPLHYVGMAPPRADS